MRAVARSFHPSKRRWHRRRERYDFYSVAAWDRNTRANGALSDRIRRPGDKILQVGGLYAPHPHFTRMKYYLFFTYTMKLAMRDHISPWIVADHEREAFIDRETRLYHHAHHIFVSAEFVKDHLIDEYGLKGDDVTVVGMGVDRFYLENMNDRPPGPTRGKCLFVGFTWDLKGGPDVLEAFRLARARRPSLELHIVGPRPTDAMRMPGVVSVGPVRDKNELLQYYRNADLFLLPSRCDSFGFVFLEAMTQGVVCIGSTLNAMPEIIEDGRTGFVVNPGDCDRLADLIVEFYDAPDRKRQMGGLAQRRVIERFTWERVAQQIIARMAT